MPRPGAGNVASCHVLCTSHRRASARRGYSWDQIGRENVLLPRP